MNKDLKYEIKDNISIYYRMIKESFDIIKLELFEINNEINIYNNFLKLVKNPKDYFKPNVMKYYYSNVFHKLIECIDELADEITDEIYDGDIKKSIEHFKMITSSNENCAEEIINIIQLRIKQLNRKKDTYGSINLYSEEINSVKHILKSLEFNKYYEDEQIFNNIIKYITESEIFDDELKSKYTMYIMEKRSSYLEKIENTKKTIALRKENAEIKKEINNSTDETKTKFNYADFLNTEEQELIKIINNEIYKNSDVLNKMTPEIIKSIKDALTFKELEIDLDSILSSYNITNYNNIVILFESKDILNKINQLLDIVKDVDNANIIEIKSQISNYIMELDQIIMNYEFEDDKVQEETENKSDYHVIYLTNSVNEILLKNDIIGDPENYRLFVEMLDELKQGIITNNAQKDVKFTNNGKLHNVAKKKRNHARLIYQPYGNCYLVFLGFIKKNDNNNYEQNLTKNRYTFYKSNIERIIEKLDDPTQREILIKENDKIHDELIKCLKSKGRTKKKQIENTKH